ncbi:MAG: TRAP transporter substrate-binding protein DctP [Deltaproteobacteria bacterium]|nr:TRAP transporter substrate-binding protein DctP [Deltaproteobacteria bacterium]
MKKVASRNSFRLVTFGMLCLGILVGGVPPVEAAVTIKLATLAPDGSIWDQAVEEMGADWKEATEGRVALKIYPGGIAGDEPDVIRKMRIGQLHAAVLTVNGLAEIDDGFNVFNIPFFFESYDELFHVTGALAPLLKQRLEKKGYVFLGWGHAGWIHLFSKEPIATLAEMKTTKFFLSAGDARSVQWWKDNGYRPVPLSTTDILSGLQTGMIEALPSPPLAALMLQWYRNAPNMLDLGFAPLVGATVVQSRVWKKVSERDRKQLEAAALRLEDHLKKEVPKQDQSSITEMEKRGLKVSRVAGTPGEKAWKDLAENFAQSVREGWVPPEILNKALAARDAYRASQTTGGGDN